MSCSVVEIRSVKIQSQSQKADFCPPARGAYAQESSDQIFKIAVISEYVSKFGCDPFSDVKD